MLLIDESQKILTRKRRRSMRRGVRREREKEEQKQDTKGEFIPEILSLKSAL
jgi:hypothetical protein